MANLTAKGFILQFSTNLHVGSGDANYGIIDKLIQREPTTGRPIIHSSSLKGSLREFFEQPRKYPFDKERKLTSPFISDIFGTHQNDDNMATGKCRFLAAYLLSLPVRSNVAPYFMSTSVDVLKELKEEAISTGFSLDAKLISEIDSIIDLFKVNGEEKFHENGPFLFTGSFGQSVIVEDWPATIKTGIVVTEIEKLTGQHLVVFNTSQFKELCSHLPVIARNQLENGISKNLWYEEVVPRFSRFFQFTLVPEEENKNVDTFIIELINQGNTFQVGANATIGYGICKFKAL